MVNMAAVNRLTAGQKANSMQLQNIVRHKTKIHAKIMTADSMEIVFSPKTVQYVTVLIIGAALIVPNSITVIQILVRMTGPASQLEIILNVFVRMVFKVKYF